MRKLKLQMQISVDGFVAGPNGELDWMTWNQDQQLKDFTEEIHKTVDTIIMGRKMSDGFTQHWEAVVNDPAADRSAQNYRLAELLVNVPKYIFSKTIHSHSGKNTIVVNGDLVSEVNKLKAGNGSDIIVYGGAGFVSSLIKAGLIDEYYLFLNPVAIGKGMQIFNQVTAYKNMQLQSATAYECGVVVLNYTNVK